MLVWLAIGLALGVATSVPIGLANVAVVDAGLRHGRRRALSIAAGAAVADFVHSGLAFAGVGPLIETHAWLPRLFFVASGLAITAYGVHVLRSSRSVSNTTGEAAPAATAEPARARSGVLVGLLLTLTNPAALLAWLVVAGALHPGTMVRGVAIAAGVGVGAFGWFAVLALWSSRGRQRLGERRHVVVRVMGVLLIALGLASVARGIL